ncbi:MAG: tetratricopeptide repeat protein [Gammaproteobacteria bacterium]|nr:tetratricopeptide repeat protein [Gammaproteobacteria bacterium]
MSRHRGGDKSAARAALGRALKMRPDHPDALHMLANIDGEEGDFARAEQRVMQALAVRPGFPAYLATLAKIQSSIGQTQLAIASLEKAIEQEPTSPRFNDMGRLLLVEQRQGEAVSAFERALEIDPANRIARINLGVACFSAGDARTAAQHLEHALSMAPGDRGVAQRLGLAWQACGEHERAISALGMARQPEKDSAALLTSLGVSYTALGRFDEALELFDAAIEIDPFFADALAGKAELLEWQGDYAQGLRILEPVMDGEASEPAVLTVYARLLRRTGEASRGAALLKPLEASGRLNGVQLRQLRFTLGDLMDQLEQYEEAFDWYRLAHQFRPNVFSIDAHRQFIEALQVRFDADALTRLNRSSLDDARPVFIVGMPRSGTSLAEQILAAHPNVFAAGERSEIGRIAQHIAPREDTSAAELTQHAEAYLDAVGGESADAQRITDKMPLNFLYLGWIAQLFPRARIVWCRRDARDTGLSCYSTNFIDPALAFCDDLGDIGRYSNSCNELMRHWQNVLDLPVFELHYENLVREPEPCVRELLGALDLDWDPQCLEFHKVERVVKTSSHAQVRESFYTRSVGRWQHYAMHLKPLLDALEQDG